MRRLGRKLRVKHVQHLRDPFCGRGERMGRQGRKLRVDTCSALARPLLFLINITAKRKQGGFVILTASEINEFVNIFCCDYFVFPGKHMGLTAVEVEGLAGYSAFGEALERSYVGFIIAVCVVGVNDGLEFLPALADGNEGFSVKA